MLGADAPQSSQTNVVVPFPLAQVRLILLDFACADAISDANDSCLIPIVLFDKIVVLRSSRNLRCSSGTRSH